MGGMVAAIEQGFPQREIAESAYRFQQAVERREKVIVGVNDFVQEDEAPMSDPLHRRVGGRHAAGAAATSCARTRDDDRVAADARRAGARRRAASGNTMYPLLDCVRAYATVGEMCDALRDVWGEYEEVPMI